VDDPYQGKSAWTPTVIGRVLESGAGPCGLSDSGGPALATSSTRKFFKWKRHFAFQRGPAERALAGKRGKEEETSGRKPRDQLAWPGGK